MDIETLYYINGLANDVIKEYELDIPEDNIENIIAKIGGTIVRENNGFDDLCEGTVMKTGDHSFSIRMSAAIKPEENRFVLAHELGHLFLHMGYRTNHKLWKAQKLDEFRRFGRVEQERQANEFAAALLMQNARFREKVRSLETYQDAKGPAKYFKVSPVAIINRARALTALNRFYSYI